MENKSKTNYSPEDVYTEIEGYGISTSRRNDQLHIGYVSPKTKLCKCGGYPVLEQFVDDVYIDEHCEKQRNFPATQFVAICPKCETRIKGHGTLEEAVERWNAEDYLEDMLMVREPLKDIDIASCYELSNRVLEEAIEDAIALVKEKNRLMEILKNPLTGDMQREAYYTNLKNIRGQMRDMMRFFRESPMMMDRDGDAVLSGIRKMLHPELSPEDRTKIKLDLFYM